MTSLWRCHSLARPDEAWQGLGGLFEASRWNPQGARIVYASQEASLATLEQLVNTDSLEALVKTFFLCRADLDDRLIWDLKPDGLPDGWDSLDDLTRSQEFGQRWLQEGKWPAMRVPSVVAPGFNVVLNPLHPDLQSGLVEGKSRYAWDPRLVALASR